MIFKYSYSTIAFFKMKYLLFFQVEDLQEKYHECLEMLMENQVMWLKFCKERS